MKKIFLKLIFFSFVFIFISHTLVLGYTVERISVSTAGDESDGDSELLYSAVSRDGRYSAFMSDATNLVSGDTNGLRDVFWHDAVTGTTTRVSVANGGVQVTDGDSGNSLSISANGRYVVFESDSAELVVGDTNGVGDIFLFDTQTETIERISVDSSEAQVDGQSRYPRVSEDGRYVVFDSGATNLVAGDTNGVFDVFLRDRTLGNTTKISTGLLDAEGDGASTLPHISPNGRYIVFSSAATNLVSGDTNGFMDVFWYDTQTDTMELITVDSNEVQSNAHVLNANAFVSEDGRYVVYQAEATNLVSGDTNIKTDIFLRDRTLGTTERISVDSDEAQVNNESWYPSITTDGRYVAFYSSATNLVLGDTNGFTDIFVRDRTDGETVKVTIAENGDESDDDSYFGYISGDGSYVYYESFAENLITDDTNFYSDIFRTPLSEYFTSSSTPAQLDLLIEFSSGNFIDSEAIGSSSISIIVAGTTTSSSLSFDLNDTGSGIATSSDYSIPSVTVTIPAGNYTSTTTIALDNVLIIDDSDDEVDETIILELSNADTGISFADVDGSSSTTTQTTITITDNDEPAPDPEPDTIPSGSRGGTDSTVSTTSVITILPTIFPTSTTPEITLIPAVEVGNQLDLLLHWTFDDVSGTFVPDNSGREKNGELLSGAKIATDTPSLSGGALLIDSSGQKTASIADDIFPEEITSLSVSYWVKYTDLSNFSGDKTISDIYYQKLINYQSGLGWHAYGLRLGINRAIDGIASIIGFGPQTDVSCLSQIFVDTQTGIPSINEWHHIAFSWDNTTREGVMYIDGQETLRSRINAGSTNDTCTFEASNAIDFIAGDGSLGFRGLIDDVRVYGRAISIDDINNIQRDNSPRNTGGENNTGDQMGTTTKGVGDAGVDLGVVIDKTVEVVSVGIKTVIDITRNSSSRISEVVEDTLKDIEPIFVSDAGQAAVVAVATSAVATGLSLSLLPVIVSQVVSVGDIGFSLFRWFGSILSFIGLTKKYKAPWGTVFDSVTKQPIDPALVTLYDSFGNEIQSRITDLDGRYGFFVPPGEYSISTKKTNYAFPSEKRGGDIVYGNLYFGEKFVVTDPTVPVALNIPMDNLAFDWNQMAKEQIGNVIFFSKVMRIGSNLLDVLSVLGIALTLFSYLTTKNVLDLYLLIAVFIVGFLKIFVFKTKQTGKIKLEDGSPASFAFVRAYSPSTGVELGKTVCDAEGRFYLLIPRGEYVLKISPFDQNLKSHSDKSFSTAPLYSKEGYVSRSISI